MRKHFTLILSFLLLTTGCAVTLKQQTLHLKRDWLEVRERAILAYSEGKLSASAVIEFVIVDESFQEKYGELVDKVLAGGDVSEDEIRYLQNLIELWKDRIP